MRHRSLDVTGRQRTHPTQILGKNDVRLGLSECLLIEMVHRCTTGSEFTDHGVDLRGRLSPGIETMDEHGTAISDAWGSVAFEGDADQVVGATERSDDFGG